MFLFFCHFKADKIKDSILKKAPSTCNLSSFEILKKPECLSNQKFYQLIPRPLRKRHSRHKTLLLLKKLIQISACRGNENYQLQMKMKNLIRKRILNQSLSRPSSHCFTQKLTESCLIYVSSIVVIQIFLFLNGVFSFLVCLYIDIFVQTSFLFVKCTSKSQKKLYVIKLTPKFVGRFITSK